MTYLSLALLLLPAGAVQLHRGAENSSKCVVFHSQHKSGGATIEQKLSRYPQRYSGVDSAEWNFCKYCKFHCDRENWQCENQTCPQESKFTPVENLKVAFKGYTPLLAGTKEWGSAGDGKCVWATMSREPISRLVSAYYYCKLRWGNDPLCGSGALDVSKSTLLEFAKHWGNYLFREFLWFPQLRKVAASRSDFRHEIVAGDMCRGSKSEKARVSDPWVLFKDQLNGGDDPRTNSGKMNLDAVKTALQNGELYDVYGVLERYNETMALFDEYMPFEGTSWMIENLVHGMHASHGSTGYKGHNHDERHPETGYKSEEEMALADARESPEILAEIAADIELYNNVILSIFDKKTLHLKSTLTQIMQDALHKIGYDKSDADGTTKEEIGKNGPGDEEQEFMEGMPQELFADYKHSTGIFADY